MATRPDRVHLCLTRNGRAAPRARVRRAGNAPETEWMYENLSAAETASMRTPGTASARLEYGRESQTGLRAERHD